MAMAIGSISTPAVATIVVAQDGTGDYTDIADGINALPSDGGYLFIKPGTYTITSSLPQPPPSSRIEGSGLNTIIQTSGNIQLFTTITNNSITIEHIYFKGSGAGNASNHCIRGSGTVNLRVANCKFDNFGGRAIYVDGIPDIIIVENCEIANCKSDGIYLTYGTRYYISNVYSHNNSGDGIEITDNAAYVHLINNYCTYNTSAGIRPSIMFSSVIGNFCAWNDLAGIALSNTAYTTVVGNMIYANKAHGINASSNTWCTFVGNFVWFNKYHGLLLSLSNDCTISGNFISDNDYNNTQTYDGIALGSDCDTCVITGNRCRDNDRYEINIAAADCDRNLVVGNVCYGTDHVGAINDSGTNTLVANNITV